MYLCADVRDIAEGASATIKIVEKDADGNDDEVDSPNTKIQNGKIKCKWKVVYMEDNDDTESQQEMEEKGYTLPEYAFTVACGGGKSTESGQLDVKNWVKLMGLPLGKQLLIVYECGKQDIYNITSTEMVIEYKEKGNIYYYF